MNLLSNNKAYKLSDLTEKLEVKIIGNADCLITGIASIKKAQAGCISFVTNSLYRKHLPATSASAVILAEKDADACPVTAVVSLNPYYTYAKIAEFFSEKPIYQKSIDGIPVIGKAGDIDHSAYIGSSCVIGNHVKISSGVYIGPGCVIGDFVEIAEGTTLDANVTLYHHVKIGKRTHLSSGVVIGSDGFGFASQGGKWHKVPQLGGVIIGDDVDIGANTTIDRGALDNTIIEDGVKLDNQIQVGHNVQIGAHTIIAGCVAIAGSTVIGKHCMVGGATCFAGHIEICDRTVITGMTAVTKSIHQPGMYSSGIVGAVPHREFRKNNARFHRLENLVQRIKSLEAVLKKETVLKSHQNGEE